MNVWLVLSSIIIMVLLWSFLKIYKRYQQALLLVGKNQKQAHAELRNTQQTLEQNNQILFDLIQDILFVIDPQGLIRAHNQATSAFFENRSILKRNFREIFLDEALIQTISICLRSNHLIEKIVTIQHHHKSRTLLISSVPISGHTQFEGFLQISMRDISHYHEANLMQKDFIANASHELRTPLAIIHGYLENLMDSDLQKEYLMAQKFHAIMLKHTLRISDIIDKLLMISRLESSEVTVINTSTFSMKNCIDDVLERLESLIQNSHSTIIVDILPADLQLKGDAFYWVQIFFNLIENAIKYNPQGQVTITIQARLLETGYLEITLTDNGNGISERDLAQVFERFYRGAKHHSQHEIKGTGLGLSIVRRAVEAHQGTISASSIPGIKTQFTITLPHS